MGIFGWSYPPGCSGPPDDGDEVCQVCGKSEDNCLCPECPVCGTYGDPKCYTDHGMVKSQAQIEAAEAYEKAMKAQEDSLAAWAEEEKKAQEDWDEYIKKDPPQGG